MYQNITKKSFTAFILMFNIGLLAGCTSLSDQDQTTATQVYEQENIATTDEVVISAPQENVEATGLIDADTNTFIDDSYNLTTEPIVLTTPSETDSYSVKEKMQEKQAVIEQEAQMRKLAAEQELLKMETQTEVATQITEDDVTTSTSDNSEKEKIKKDTDEEFSIKSSKEEEKEKTLMDNLKYGEQSQDWNAPAGETLRSLLMKWGEQSGWTVVWKLDRDYQLEAGVIFRGTFTEVASSFIRSFARATPAPVATFYNGNRVLVINTQETENAN